MADPAIGIYGDPPRVLAAAADGLRFSPLIADGERWEAQADASLDAMTLLAPPGTIERRYVLAQAIRVLRTGAPLVTMARKTRGGARLGAELAAFGCEVHERAKAHHRICHCARPAAPVGIDAAIAAGAMQIAPDLGLWTQPGLFSWDRLDPGSALLMRTGEPFAGAGVDVGCGYGVLSLSVLASPAVRDLLLVDIDRRAVDAARRNVTDNRARFLHGDALAALAGIEGLDFAVVNPPFHAAGRENRDLGRGLVAASAKALKRGGICRIVANVALPYETAMAADLTGVRLLAREGGFKVLEGRR